MANFPTGTDLPADAATDTSETLATMCDGQGQGSSFNQVKNGLAQVYSKVGTGASTPTAGTALLATGTGTSAWGSVTERQLNYVAATDIANGVSIATGGSFTDIGTNQSFTVDDANSTVLIDVRGYIQVLGGSGVNIGARIVIDSAGTPQNILIGGAYQATSQSVNALGGVGMVAITGLSAASHTVKVQLTSSGASASAYCRASSTAYEFLAITVLELKR